MRQVFLPIGPQCAGKSTFCRQAAEINPEIEYISRDATLTEMFGSAWLNPYTGQHFAGLEKMWKMAKSALRAKDCTLILDTWNATGRDRKSITQRLRAFGAQRIEAWRFVTPQNVYLAWYKQRECSDLMSKDPKRRRIFISGRLETYRRHFQAFRSHRVTTAQGFDAIRKINPLTTNPAELFAESRAM